MAGCGLKVWMGVAFSLPTFKHLPTALRYRCLRYRKKHVKCILISCGCLQICNLVVNMVVMGLVLGQSLMVIPTECYHLMSKMSSHYNVIIMRFVVVYM